MSTIGFDKPDGSPCKRCVSLVNEWVPLLPRIESRPIGPAVLDRGQEWEGVTMEADEDHVEDDAHLGCNSMDYNCHPNNGPKFNWPQLFS